LPQSGDGEIPFDTVFCAAIEILAEPGNEFQQILIGGGDWKNGDRLFNSPAIHPIYRNGAAELNNLSPFFRFTALLTVSGSAQDS